MEQVNNSIKFVTPCCHTPLEINSLDELTVEERHLHDDPAETKVWWIKDQCCGDCYGTEAEARKALEQFKLAVFKASIRHAREELEKKFESMRSALDHEVSMFCDWHDPQCERVYLVAMWGKDGERLVGNHGTRELDREKDGIESVNAKAEYLVKQGYAEVENDEPANQGMKIVRKFAKDDKIRYVGMWSVPYMRIGGGSGSTECEASYLCTA